MPASIHVQEPTDTCTNCSAQAQTQLSTPITMPTPEIPATFATPVKKQPSHKGRSKRHHYDERREELIRAVIDTCTETGIAHMSVSAVSGRAGCTRSLFYHYFPTKEAAIEAALDYSVEATIARLSRWSAEQDIGNTQGALESFAALFKELIVDTPSMLEPLAVGTDATRYTRFISRVSERAASYICNTSGKDCSLVDEASIDYVYETLYVLISGLITYTRAHPNASVGLIRDIIASTLHLEHHPLNSYK